MDYNIIYRFYIIYELYGDTTKIIDGFYFEKDDIVLNIKYGWNEEKIEYSFANVEIDNYKLICFVSYICLERYRSYNPCDDYKNFDKSILIEEIDKEVFLSDYYKANFGKSNFFKSEPPIFSEENEGIKLKLTPEYLNWIVESTENYSKKFYFAVVPIYYDSINNKYLLYFGSKYDGIEIEYHYDEEKNRAPDLVRDRGHSGRGDAVFHPCLGVDLRRRGGGRRGRGFAARAAQLAGRAEG